MDDYFYFQNTLNRDLSDIVYLDVLNERETDPQKIDKLKSYIEQQVKAIKTKANAQRLL